VSFYGSQAQTRFPFSLPFFLQDSRFTLTVRGQPETASRMMDLLGPALPLLRAHLRERGQSQAGAQEQEQGTHDKGYRKAQIFECRRNWKNGNMKVGDRDPHK
jgi:hypothetical protein